MTAFVEQTGASVRISGLCKCYRKLAAVDHVDLDIAPGEFVSLLGPSGSGKTTLLMCIAGFVFPDAGQIVINGEAVVSKPAHRRNIGMVFQDYALFPHMTVFENIAFPLKVRRLPGAEVSRKVGQALELVRLDGLGERSIRQLSGGQQQRVALARAIVYAPDLLLMDEPLGALDKKIREHLQLEIKNIQKEIGVTVIYVTHDQEEGLVMSDRIAVMRAGRIMQSGSPRHIYESPNSEFVADFLGDSNILRGELVTAPHNGYATIRIAAGIRLEGRVQASKARGEEVKCLIRPECLRLHAASAEHANGDNSVPGRISETIYVGQATRYYLSVGDDQTVCVFETNRGGATPLQVGTAAKAVCKRESILVL